jgi:peroxiredoxin Q/BCP
LRDEQEAVKALNMEVLGVSYDGVKANKAFADKQDFNFLLLSDADKSIAKAYGAKGLLPLAKRVSYVIDEEGRILLAYPDVNPKTHIDVILHDLGVR